MTSTEQTASLDERFPDKPKMVKTVSLPVTKIEKNIDPVSIDERSSMSMSTPTFELFNRTDMDFELWAKKKKAKTPKQKLIDKLIYVFLTVNFGVTCLAVGGHGGFLPWYYTIKFPFLIFIRFYTYKSKSWQWFLLDFCYFGNALLFIYLWIWPSKYLFTIVFSIANGPLLVAIPVFTNSLVFHSVDKTTSLLIHITPSIVTYIFRFRPNELSYWNANDRWSEDNICKSTKRVNDMSDCGSFYYAILYPFLYMVMHQCIYGFIVQFVFRKKIESDPNALTTYRYLFRKRSGFFYNLISIFGAKFRVYLFAFFFVFYGTICFFITAILFREEYVQFFFILACALVACWNGSNFYDRIFSNSNFERVGKYTVKKIQEQVHVSNNISIRVGDENENSDSSNNNSNNNSNNKS